MEDRLRRVWESVPRSPDEDAILEGRMPKDAATEIRTALECVLDHRLRTAIQSLEPASRVTDDDLRRELRLDRSSRGGAGR